MRSKLWISPFAAAVLLVAAAPAHADWDAGIAAYKSGNYAQAAQLLQEVVEAQPEWPNGLLMLGQTYLKLNRNQDALTHLRKAYDLKPDDVQTQLVLGKAYLDLRRYGDAAKLLGGINAAALPKSHQGALYQMRAKAHEKSGRNDLALADLENAVKVSPDNANLQYQYGTLAFNEGDTRTAIAALDKAVQLDATDPAKHRARVGALVRLGRETRGTEKAQAYTRAVGAARELVARDPSFESLMLLGDAELGAKQYEEAISTYGQAAAKNSRDWLPLYYIGQAYTATKTYRLAEESLDRALQKASSVEDQNLIWKQLAFVYEKRQNFDQAIAAYNRIGDSASAQRVQENRDIAAHNEEVDEETQRYEELKAEEEALRKQLEELPGGPPPGA